MDDLKIEPLRSLDDFLLNSARFQVPDFRNVDRWARRVKANLVYYQTNYFLMSIIILLVVGMMHPLKMVLGMASVVVMYGGYDYLSKNQRVVADFRQDRPLVSLGIVFVCGYFLISLFGSVMVFMFGVLLPFAATFIHASLRLRNTLNKIKGIQEKIGFNKTPMTVILDALDMKFEGFDD